MMKQTIRSISLSALMALALWSRPIGAMEQGNVDTATAFRVICVVLDDSSRLQLRLSCKKGIFLVNETYSAINNSRGVLRQWDGLDVNGTLRYYLNQHTCRFLWLLNKSIRGLMGAEDGAILTKLYGHIGNFPLFVGQGNKGSALFTACLAQLTSSDDLPKQAKSTFDSILALPGNACAQEIGKRALRITELRSQNPQTTAEDFGVWKELFTIDPNMTPDDLEMAVTACYAIHQRYSVNGRLSSKDYKMYVVPLAHDNYKFLQRFTQLYDQNDERMKNMRLNYWSNCNSVKKYDEAYQQFLILEGAFGFGLPSIDSPDHFYQIHYFIETFSNLTVSSAHFEALEAYLLGKGESPITLDTYNTGYFLLARLYANKKMYQKLVNLYKEQRKHFISSWDTLQQYGVINGIFNACLALENFDVASDVLEQGDIALNGSEGTSQNSNQYSMGLSSSKMGEMKRRQGISIKRAIVDFAKGDKGAALARMYPIASTLSESRTLRETLSNPAAYIQLFIFLMEGKAEDVVQTLEKMDLSDSRTLFSLIYLKDKYYPLSTKEIADLKKQYFYTFNVHYEEDMENKFSYETAVLNILTKHSVVP